MELLTRSSTKWPPTLTSTVDRAVASMTVRDKIDAAKKELGAVVSASRATQNAVDLIGGINTTVSQIDTINSTCFDPLKAFNTVVSTIANVLYLTWSDKQDDIYTQVHPYTQMALGLLTGAAQVCPSGWLRHASHITVRWSLRKRT